MDLIICLLENFALIIFVVGHTLFRWADTAIKFPVHLESATAEFNSFVSCVCVLWLALDRDCYINIYFKVHCKLHHYRLMYYVYDYIPHLSLILSYICVNYCFMIPPLDCI